MNEQFKKGQLVAVRDNADGRWSLWIYDHASPEGLHFCRSPNHMIGPRWWRYAVPAENVWPDIFLGWERRAGEQAAEAVAMESELVQRLRRKISWLCKQLGSITDYHCHCLLPHGSGGPNDSCETWDGCAECWEQASLKAAKEKPCP